MNAATPKAFRETHSVAGAIHKAQSESGMPTEELAAEIVESLSFLNGVLKGEDGLDRLINIAFLKKIADATGRDLTIKIYATKRKNRSRTVKSGKGSQP